MRVELRIDAFREDVHVPAVARHESRVFLFEAVAHEGEVDEALGFFCREHVPLGEVWVSRAYLCALRPGL